MTCFSYIEISESFTTLVNENLSVVICKFLVQKELLRLLLGERMRVRVTNNLKKYRNRTTLLANVQRLRVKICFFSSMTETLSGDYFLETVMRRQGRRWTDVQEKMKQYFRNMRHVW